ncbi:hypothetical protein CBR_g21763 [Chara braunii]|uniref:Sugar phosphate transporter domain-containing protein n=1 Tax=Chara braunii TaxID=69332 RepID=A0A388L1M2_CHABU|nr:hypothetical protein CBR_g21763 [Chara braunii]|eukprot:GBG76103.1 hypothetical protein CBR_g21763 [Chara braunii]
MDRGAKSSAWVIVVVIGYALSSSLLAIMNKVAMMAFPFPSVLLILQYLTCVVVVMGLGRLGVLHHESLNLATIKSFFLAAVVFYLALFTNTKLLLHANVDTFIVFRSSTPLLVAIAESLFMKKAWPSKYTFSSLCIIFLGAVAYVSSDRDFTVKAYSWAFAYLFTITVEMVYIKHIVMSVGLSTWGLVLYNNFLALLFSPFFFFASGEIGQLQVWRSGSTLFPPSTWVPVFVCCILGLSISFFGFAARRAVSATAFTVIGVTNKLLTILINVIFLPHASMLGTCSLLLCIVGGVVYQQSTSSPSPPPPQAKPPTHSLNRDEEMGAEDGGEGGGGQDSPNALLLRDEKSEE